MASVAIEPPSDRSGPGRPGPVRRGLVRRALASGLVDRLAAPHGIDTYLDLLDPRWTVHEVRAEVVAVERQTPDTVTLTLQPNDAWAGFRPGQHVVVGVTVDGVVHERCFSLAGSPHHPDGTLELTVKANPTGRVSRHLVDHAAPGLVLRLSEARGEFVLPEPASPDLDRHLVLISGGSGVTPVLSMLRTLVHRGHAGPVTFVHYARTAADHCYAAEVEALVDSLPGGRLLVGLTEAPGSGDLDGFFGTEHLAAITDEPAEVDVYLCGPEPLMAAVDATFAELGLVDRIRRERFGPLRMAGGLAPPSADPDAPTVTVTFGRSGRSAPEQGTLLETAEAAGLEPRFGCRQGICGTCTTTKTSGVVRNLVTGQESAPDTERIRLCVSRPCGDVTLDC